MLAPRRIGDDAARSMHARPAVELGLKVECVDRGLALVDAPLVTGQHPHHLELVAVGVGAIDASWVLLRRLRHTSSIGGPSDSDDTALAVAPKSSFWLRVVMTVTPLAKCPMTCRHVSLSVRATLTPSSRRVGSLRRFAPPLRPLPRAAASGSPPPRAQPVPAAARRCDIGDPRRVRAHACADEPVSRGHRQTRPAADLDEAELSMTRGNEPRIASTRAATERGLPCLPPATTQILQNGGGTRTPVGPRLRPVPVVKPAPGVEPAGSSRADAAGSHARRRWPGTRCQARDGARGPAR